MTLPTQAPAPVNITASDDTLRHVVDPAVNTGVGRALDHAAALLTDADALFVGAGAGMSADSGIAVYRGPAGRYTSPTVLAEANADTFTTDPVRAAETTRRRYNEVRAAHPHPGYAILNTWRQRLPHGAFTYTSNIDSMFTRAGFPSDTVYEVHGALARSQCLTSCAPDVTVFDTTPPEHGPACCPACGGIARPNVLLFGDYAFHDGHRQQQWENFAGWSDALPDAARVAIVEVGAGTDVATVRNKCESLSAACGWPLVRINPHESAVPEHCAPGSIAVPLNALLALDHLDSRVTALLRDR